jgi:hypothetical protein
LLMVLLWGRARLVEEEGRVLRAATGVPRAARPAPALACLGPQRPKQLALLLNPLLKHRSHLLHSGLLRLLDLRHCLLLLCTMVLVMSATAWYCLA